MARKPITNPVNEFFLKEAPPATGGEIGWQLARKLACHLKTNFSDMEDGRLLTYLIHWNERGDAPFTMAQLIELSQIKAEEKPKRAKKPGPENFAVSLFE